MGRPADDEDVTGRPIEAHRPPNEVAISPDFGALPPVVVELGDEGDIPDSFVWRFVLRGCKHLCSWASKQFKQFRRRRYALSKTANEGVGQPAKSDSTDGESGPDAQALPRS